MAKTPRHHRRRLLIIASGALLIGLPVLIYLAWPSRVDPLRFRDLALNDKVQQLSSLAARDTVTASTTSHEGLLGYVGLVFVVDRSSTGTRPAVSRLSTIPTFRPARDLVTVQPVNKILFEGKVSKSLNAGGTYTAFTANLSADQAADVVVTDEVYFGYKDLTTIPYKELAKLKMEPGKVYYFVESATLTTTTHKVYQKIAGDSAINGTAFQANGEVYVSESGFMYDAVLGLDLFDVGLLQPDEGGGDPKLSALLRKRDLTLDEASHLVDLLISESKAPAATDFADVEIKVGA